MAKIESYSSYLRTVGKNISIQMVCRGISVVAGLISTALLTRMLGPSGYGIFTGVFATVSIVGLVADGGLNIYSTGELGKDPKGFFRGFRSVLALKAMLVAGFAVVSLVLMLALRYPPEKLLLGFLAIAGLSVGYISSFGIAVTTGLMRVIEATLTDTVGRVLSLVVVVLILLRFPGPAVPFVGMLVANSAVAVWLYFRLRSRFPDWGKVEKSKILETAHAVFPLAIGMVWTVTYAKIDSVILAAMRPSAEVGIYGVSYLVLDQMLTLWGLYMMTAFPHLASAHRKGLGKETLVRERLVAAVTSVFAVVAIVLVGTWVIRLVAGAKFEGSIPLLTILMLGLPVFSQNNLSYHWLIVRNRQKMIPWIYAVACAVNVVLNLVTIPRFGAYAAAWNTVATELVVAVGYMIVG